MRGLADESDVELGCDEFRYALAMILVSAVRGSRSSSTKTEGDLLDPGAASISYVCMGRTTA